MKNAKTNYVLVGGFVMAALTALIVTVAILTGRTGATDRYSTVFDNVSGIKFGTQVQFEGYPIGQVEEIQPVGRDGRRSFKVDMSVVRGWNIPTDAKAYIASPGFLSALTIDIRSPGSTAEHFKPGAEIPGAAAGNIFAAVNDVAAEVQDLSRNSVKPLLDNLNRYIGALGEALATETPAFLKDMRSVAAELATRTPRIAADVENFSGRLNESSARLMNQENLDKLDTVIASFAETSQNLAENSRNLKTTRAHLDKLLTDADAMVDDQQGGIGQALADLNHILDSVARNIDAITYNLEGTSRNMAEFSRQIRNNPGLLLRGTEPDPAAKEAR